MNHLFTRKIPALLCCMIGSMAMFWVKLYLNPKI